MKFAKILVVAAMLAGCGGAGTEPVGVQEQAAAGGCRTVCPKCHPGQVCPAWACYLDCHTRCTQTQLCIIGYVWDSKKCQCVPDTSAPGCTTDADCRTFADYCTGCDCLALTTSDADPVCSGPGVRCFADPCLGHTAVCVGGSCALQ